MAWVKPQVSIDDANSGGCYLRRNIPREEHEFEVRMTLCQERAKRTALRAFRRMVDRFPELVTKCHQCPAAVDRLQPSQMFFGRPVVVVENVFLLSGKVGARLRHGGSEAGVKPSRGTTQKRR